jgi:hypothetical protein
MNDGTTISFIFTVSALPFQGGRFCVSHYPPRCGGLLRIAPIGAKDATTLLSGQITE